MLVTDFYWFANCLGLLSLLGLTIVFFPAISNIFNKQHAHERTWFLVFRGGLTVALFFGLIHGLLMTQKEDINFYDLRTYWVYAEGLLTFNLLSLFAFSFGEIKSNQKRFVYFTYALLFLVGCHLSGSGLMSGQ